MAPKPKEKRKKKSKEEIDAERILVEQEAECQRQIEELRIAEEKAAVEQAERQAQEERNSNRSKELETLIKCYEEGLPIHGTREMQLKEKADLMVYNQKWISCLECNLKEWQNMTFTENFYAFESQLCERSLSLENAVSSGGIICSIIDDIEAQAIRERNYKAGSHAMEFVSLFKKLILTILEGACCQLLNKSEEYASISTDGDNALLVEVTDQMGAGIWVNSVPQEGKSKRLNFEKMGMLLEIPRMLAISRLAIRVLSFPFDFTDITTSCSWDIIGGTFRLDLFPLPPPHRKTGNFHVQHVPTSAAFSIISDEVIKFRIRIPNKLVLCEDIPLEIGRWDDQQQEWDRNAVTNVKPDVPSMSITFDAASTSGVYAIIQSRTKELKFFNWELSPFFEVNSGSGIRENRTVVRYSVRSKHFHLIFHIDEGYCYLISPDLPQLQHLKSSKLLPKEMIRSLKDCGINLSFSDSVVSNAKCLRVEERAYNDLSWLSSSFCARSSTFNENLGPNKACYLIKEAEFFVVDDEDCDSDDAYFFHIALTEQDSSSSSALGASEPALKTLPSGYGTVKCTLIEFQDSQGSANADLNTAATVNGTRSGIHMIQCIRPLCTQECIDREVNCSPILADTVKQLLQLTRPLSCC